MIGPQLALKNATDSRLNRAWAGLIAKMRPPSAGSRIDATDEVSARYGLRSKRLLLEHDVPHRDRVPRRESVAPVVVRQAELAEAGDGLDRDPLARPGPPRETKPHIAAADRDGLARRVVRCADFAVAAAVGRVDQVIQAPKEPVDSKLRVPFAEAGQHDVLLVGAPIAVTIAEEPDVRRSRHQHAAEARHHAVGKGSPSAKTVACS